MKFKTEGKLKVLSKKKEPSGSGHSMEATRGNSPNYTSRHVRSKGANNHAVAELSSQKVIMPCRSRLEVSEPWAPGDVVEAFDNNSWKMATVSEVLGKMYILVRLLGSSQEFKVRKSDIRVRQSWKDDDDARAMVGKGNKNSNGGKHHTNLVLNHSQNSTSQVQKTNSRTTLQRKDDCFAIRNKSFQDSHKVRILKRSTDCSSGALYGDSHKVRLIEKEGRYVKMMVAANPSELPELQVGAVSHPRDSLGESHRPASLNHRLGGHLEMDVKGKEPVSPVRELNDVDSAMCSVGSCSISSDDSSELPCDVSAGVTEQIAGHFCDNRSLRPSGCEGHCHPTKEELAAEIHRVLRREPCRWRGATNGRGVILQTFQRLHVFEFVLFYGFWLLLRTASKTKRERGSGRRESRYRLKVPSLTAESLKYQMKQDRVSFPSTQQHPTW